MKNPNIKTEVKHSESKNAWNIIGTELGAKYKIARVPYVKVIGYNADEINMRNESEALEHARFISWCFNNSDNILK